MQRLYQAGRGLFLVSVVVFLVSGTLTYFNISPQTMETLRESLGTNARNSAESDSRAVAFSVASPRALSA